MNKSIELLKRWQAMDCDLFMEDGLSPTKFAKRFAISERQVRRDVAMFRELGQCIVDILDRDGCPTGALRYDEYQPCMFVPSEELRYICKTAEEGGSVASVIQKWDLYWEHQAKKKPLG